MKSVAIIGAGLSGLTLALRLKQFCDVVIFEKTTSPGGRLASLTAGPWTFDYGAQFLTTKNAEFAHLMETATGAGAVADWNARFAELSGPQVTATRQWTPKTAHYAGCPAMGEIGRWLGRDLDVRFGVSVAAMESRNGLWHLLGEDKQRIGRYDWVITTAPAAQSAALLPPGAASLEHARQAPMTACLALMLGFENDQPVPWQAALVRDADISWISVNSSKPGRSEPFSLVVLSTNAWADTHFQDNRDMVVEHLLRETSRVAGIDACKALHIGLHRWRYANLKKQAGHAPQLDAGKRVAACGDWFLQGRAECAFTSANLLAEQLIAALQGS